MANHRISVFLSLYSITIQHLSEQHFFCTTWIQLFKKEEKVFLKLIEREKALLLLRYGLLMLFFLKNAYCRNDQSSISQFQGSLRHNLQQNYGSPHVCALLFNHVFSFISFLGLYLLMCIFLVQNKYFYCKVSQILYLCVNPTYVVQQT